jgi:hypothetical protein
MDLDQHLAAFVEAFVVPGRRERLKYIFSRRGKNARAEGSSLFAHLDARLCKQVQGNLGLDENAQGAFYDFRHEPRAATLREAMNAAGGDDVIFSIVPGKLAVFLSHEGWSWLCRR